MKLIAFVLAAMAVLGAAVWVGAGTTGIISGVVKSDDGKPISGANIIVTGTKLTTVTDANGYYVVTNVPPGDYEVRAEMVGYANAVADHIQAAMDSTTKVNLDMTQEAIKETTAVITRPRPMIAPDQINTLSLISSGQENSTRTDPTAINTVPGVLSTIPGVLVEPNETGLMHIRGGRSDQIGYYIEGIPVTDPNLGTFSDNMFSTGVSKFQAYTGGFGAEYGNAISGVLNEVKKTGETSPGMAMNTYCGNEFYRSATTEIGGGTPGGFSYYGTGTLQRNEMSGSRVLKQQTYSDNVAKLVWPWKNDSLTLLAMQGSLQGDIGGDVLPLPGDFMKQRYAITGAVWSHNYGPKSFLTVRPYYIYVSAIQSVMNNAGILLDAESYQTGLQASYTSQISDKQLLKFGGSLLRSDNNQYLYVGVPWYKADVNTSQVGLYAEQQFKPADKWTFNAGARFDSITYDRKGLGYVAQAGYTGAPIGDATEASLTPRLGLSYAHDSRTVWKASWGQYTKFVPAGNVQQIYADPTMPGTEDYQSGLGATAPQESTAGEISFEKQVSDSIAYRVTPYYANYRHLGDYVADANSIVRYTNLGRGESRGVEFALRKKMSSNWQGWLSYTYQTVKVGKGVGPLEYASWDQRNTLALVTDYKKGKWAHTLRSDFGSGRADIGGVGRSNPYVVFTYGLKLDLPKGNGLADSVSVGLYNILNDRQAAQYTYSYGPRSADALIGVRFLSIGLNRTL